MQIFLAETTNVASSIPGYVYGIIEWVAIILIFRKAGDSGVISYIPVLNFLKLAHKTKVLLLSIIFVLLAIIGVFFLICSGVGILSGASQEVEMASAGFGLIGMALLLVSFIMAIFVDIKMVKKLETNPGIGSFLACIFFQPFYLLYMGLNKKDINF